MDSGIFQVQAVDGTDLTGQTVQYKVMDESVCSVSSGGIVTPLAVGSSEVLASCGGKSGRGMVHVVDEKITTESLVATIESRGDAGNDSFDGLDFDQGALYAVSYKRTSVASGISGTYTIKNDRRNHIDAEWELEHISTSYPDYFKIKQLPSPNPYMSLCVLCVTKDGQGALNQGHYKLHCRDKLSDRSISFNTYRTYNYQEKFSKVYPNDPAKDIRISSAVGNLYTKSVQTGSIAERDGEKVILIDRLNAPINFCFNSTQATGIYGPFLLYPETERDYDGIFITPYVRAYSNTDVIAVVIGYKPGEYAFIARSVMGVPYQKRFRVIISENVT